MDRPPALNDSPNGSAKGASKGINHLEVSRKLKTDYSHGAKEPAMRAISSLDAMVKRLAEDDLNLEEMLEQATKIVFTQFNIREVSIALRSESDGLFRYSTMHGMRAEIWAAHKGLSYTEQEVLDSKKHKHTVISSLTRLYLAEDNPYTEDEAYTFSEHLMTIGRRMAPDDSIEGDYIDVSIFGPDSRLLGWIETGSTWGNKIPDAGTIRGLELLASILGVAIYRSNRSLAKGAHGPAAKP
jgi:hypothetical protein